MMTTFNQLLFFKSAMTPVYLALCVLGTVVLLPISLFVFGLSVRSDAVFGVLVMLGAPLGDLAFRRLFKARMLFAATPRIEVLYVWPLIGLYVATFKPFE